MKNSLKIAFCAIATALILVMMFMGSLLAVFAYITPMLAGILMLVIKKTFGTSSAWITYVSSSLLSFMLVSDKECMLMFVMFFGFYPMIKSRLEALKIKSLSFVLKLLIFNLLMSGVQLLLIYVFMIPFLDDGESNWFVLLFIVLLNVLFVTYDFLLNKVYVIYEKKLEPRIKKLLK